MDYAANLLPCPCFAIASLAKLTPYSVGAATAATADQVNKNFAKKRRRPGPKLGPDTIRRATRLRFARA